MKADNSNAVNFIGADAGSINVTSGSNIILKGNINNVAGTTAITAQNGASIIQSSLNPVITSKSVNLTAGGSVGGVPNPGDTFIGVAGSLSASPLTCAPRSIAAPSRQRVLSDIPAPGLCYGH